MDFGRLRVDRHIRRDGDAVGVGVERRIVEDRLRNAPRRQLADRVDAHGLGVVLILLQEGQHHVAPVFGAEFLEAFFPGPDRRQAGQVVAVELFGRADVAAADVDHLGDVAIVALDAHAGQDQPFLVDVLRAGAVGGGRRKADVAQMRARHRVEGKLPVEKDRSAQREIAAMRVAVIGAVVDEAVAGPDVAAELGRHRTRDQVDGADMHGKSQCHADRLEIGVGEAAGEIHRRVEDPRPPRAEERVDHLADDGFEAAPEHDHGEEIDFGGRDRLLGVDVHSWFPSSFRVAHSAKRRPSVPFIVSDGGHRPGLWPGAGRRSHRGHRNNSL